MYYGIILANYAIVIHYFTNKSIDCQLAINDIDRTSVCYGSFIYFQDSNYISINILFLITFSLYKHSIY